MCVITEESFLQFSFMLISDRHIFCPQYYSDANDAESWIKEKMPVVCNEDYGRDEQSAMVNGLDLTCSTVLQVNFRSCSCVNKRLT